ncbi:zinc ribbon domain-containing protein [Halorubrum sp. BV1]|uniref:zinc ribbon domain-containing protein n=1 Tax=Halorubrum sp. BV1 TaxID=1498500 RepID=UPI000678C35E|nr:zinc ribbon domain-containing protein [Halorubrum sp. BV1]
MVEGGTVYFAITGVLLLVALALGVRVLKNIYKDGQERRRRRNAGDMEPYTKDESYGSPPSASPDEGDDESGRSDRGDASIACPQCGAVNDPTFNYCRQCASRLRPTV